MARLYSNNRTGSKHTYRFYKERRDDPRWHDDFIEVRSLRRKERLFASLVFLLVLLIGIGLFGDQISPVNYTFSDFKGSDKTSKKSSFSAPASSSSSEKPAEESSEPTKKDETDSSNEQSNKEIVKKYLIGNGFRINPILFDGEDTDQAMNENKAPQNLAHDGIELLLFKDESTVTVKGVPAYFFPSDTKYNISDKFLTIGSQLEQIPYSIVDGKVEFHTWTSSDNFDGQTHSITWQISPDDSVQSLIDQSLKFKAEEEANLKNK
ncbi:hypothetical protein [Xylocopilactobacillus apis]|uniref:DUF4367 domain-containing protein n=1 Tax=Xylocopilactobacillus apis TaxID=2932183 RepID=A0AAU9CT07_9LACO|nr:hypothetical protein [Xylocopilactobacillus apis]BDR55506.1 hypothetical protein KIMC2_00680 [Xylocopilactobacillus apis]